MAVPQQLMEQLLALDESQRLEIAYALLESIDDEIDGMSDEEWAQLDAALERSLAHAKTARITAAEEVIDGLRAKRAACRPSW